MEDKRSRKEEREVHPKERGNFFKHFFFCWQLPLFAKGFKKELNEDDLYSPLKEYDAKVLGDRLEELWMEEKNCQKEPSLWRALRRQFGFEFLLHGVIYLPVNLSSLILKPYLLNKILDYFLKNQNVTLKQAYTYAGLITILVLLHVLFFNFMMIQMTALGMKVRIACSALIYRQILKLKQTEMQRVTAGKVINLLSNDVTKFDESLTFAHFIWITPIQIGISIWYLSTTVDPSSCAGIGILILFLLLQVYISKKVAERRNRVAQKTDHRLRLVNDVILGIQAIKMHTWEDSFSKLVEGARNSEMREVRVSNLLDLASVSFQMYLLPLTFLASVTTSTLLGLHLTPQYVYSLSSLFQDLMFAAIALLPAAIIQVAQGSTSIKRIQEFLLNGSNLQPKYALKQETEKRCIGINIDNISVILDYAFILRNVTFSALPGELIGVMGNAGAGKSVLLQVILKEIETTDGTVKVEGSIAYAPQNPWIFSGSIRQNVLFGENLDLEKYHTVVRVCALQEDFDSFQFGDETLVGERGIMLSGGQKARISLARAIYKNADIYLLDDPLSAVDSCVARHIVEECILKYLKDKCVVLVTHQVQYLHKAHRVYVVEGGTIHGTTTRENHQVENSPENIDKYQTASRIGNLPKQPKEHRRSGYNTLGVLGRYVTAAGHWSLTFAVLSLLVLTQAFKSLTDYFLTFWTNNDNNLAGNNLLVAYGTTVLCLILATSGCLSLLVIFCTRSSSNLHRRLFSNVIKGKMLFFSHHSSGRILNRFSEDVGAVDEILPLYAYLFLLGVSLLIGMIVLISFINYWMVIPSVVLCLMMYLGAIVFQRTNRSLKRTETITRSCIFSHVTATVQGLATIRAFNAQEILSQEFCNHQNFHTSAFYLITGIYYSFGMWIALAYVLYIGILVFSFIFLSTTFYVDSVGLAISLSTTLTETIQYIVKDWSVVYTHLTSVERIVDYIDLDPEPDTGTAIPVDRWPIVGNVTFDSVTLRYSLDTPEVLKQVTFHVSSGQKIGIVGRTGAGKTSLVSALFRLFDFEGAIIIDGYNTKSLPLKVLRSKMSIIPQDPVLFVGTLRRNLDPFDQFTDEQIWLALGELELKSTSLHLPEGLQSEILDGGCNFSVGQRQLLCLARTLLKRSKIIILDEATANVDPETDKIIQSTIRRKFVDCTVLIIAHRLNTVIDCDKILVMESGRVVEFDHPSRLLEDCQSSFYSFVKENGEEMMQDLRQAATDSYRIKTE